MSKPKGRTNSGYVSKIEFGRLRKQFSSLRRLYSRATVHLRKAVYQHRYYMNHRGKFYKSLKRQRVYFQSKLQILYSVAKSLRVIRIHELRRNKSNLFLYKCSSNDAARLDRFLRFNHIHCSRCCRMNGKGE